MPLPPNFLGIGAARCGTTTLYSYLRHHSQVGVAHVKELNWFGWNGDRWLSPTPHRPQVNCGVMDRNLYELHFPATRRARGEISPPYQFLLHNIARVYPGMRVILCVRNPIERLISHARMVLTFVPPWGREQFIQCCATPDSLLLQAGCYRNTVLACQEFGLPLHVVDFRDIVQNQRAAWLGVCDFLEIDPWLPDKDLHEHAGTRYLPASVVPETLIEYAKGYYARPNSFMLRKYGIDLFTPTGDSQ